MTCMIHLLSDFYRDCYFKALLCLRTGQNVYKRWHMKKKIQRFYYIYIHLFISCNLKNNHPSVCEVCHLNSLWKNGEKIFHHTFPVQAVIMTFQLFSRLFEAKKKCKISIMMCHPLPDSHTEWYLNLPKFLKEL